MVGVKFLKMWHQLIFEKCLFLWWHPAWNTFIRLNENWCCYEDINYIHASREMMIKHIKPRGWRGSTEGSVSVINESTNHAKISISDSQRYAQKICLNKY